MLPYQTQILALATPKVVAKNGFLAEEGKRTEYLYYVKTGLLRHFYTLPDKEMTSWFTMEEQFATTTAFLTGQRSRESIIALEDVEVLAIKRTQLLELYEQKPEFERFGRVLAEYFILHLEENFLELANKSAPERYALIETRYPALLQRVPLGHLASFLGMSQETLSRIRAKR